MTDDQLKTLRLETVDLFYHGFDNYMEHAFPEDELKPLACAPLTRDRANPAHIEVNDVLGNYSLTLIDSLSTLAILASSPEPLPNGRDPWNDFQSGIEAVIDLYGDGSHTSRGQGTRSRGFDQDSKVQVFETVIRGVGGLLSAHLFAVGDLPVKRRAREYTRPSGLWSRGRKRSLKPSWSGSFQYDGQLLRLAVDLANRLVPAFYTPTGLPYPRVNLRHGVPFYLNSPLNIDPENGMCEKEPSGPLEITETCSAGAGSLVLEFSTLSRLTGNPVYEELAKNAFWAVWDRRSDIDLLGAGVDAETGQWVNTYAGIGAGVDSFFEYALKSHILLSPTSAQFERNTSESFLTVWEDAHAGIKKHLYRGQGYQHPHYIQSDLLTGASKAFWVDSLSAFYPGLLALGGELDEAIETHLLYTALWTRYAALPERWSTATSTIDGGLRWWGGRPEFIESTWYIYRATQDPFYLHVGEMALKDIKRRCWTECGWAGLEDVRTGELKDRMESFFLGETAKYFYLLFDPDHPLNKLDAPFVFTTEGHPLIIPSSSENRSSGGVHLTERTPIEEQELPPTCQKPVPSLPFSISVVASRPDLFHAAGLARLHQLGITPGLGDEMPLVESSYNIDTYAEAVLRSPNNYTFYPWTLPAEYIPANGTSARMSTKSMFDLMFPTLPNTAPGQLFVNRVDDGVVINAVSGLKLSMVKEMGFVEGVGLTEVFRIHSVGALNLGRDEKVYISLETVASLNPVDPYFTRHRDLGMVDLVLDMPPESSSSTAGTATEIVLQRSEDIADEPSPGNMTTNAPLEPLFEQAVPTTDEQNPQQPPEEQQASMFHNLLQHFQTAFDVSNLNLNGNALRDLLAQAGHQMIQLPGADTGAQNPLRPSLAATIATGAGAAPLPSVPDAPLQGINDAAFWTHRRIYIFDDTLCSAPLPVEIAQNYHVLVIKRGDCNFSNKLRNIPSFAPSGMSLQLVIVVSPADGAPGAPGLEGELIRPYLEEEQYTPSGVRRVHPIALIMIDGGKETWRLLRRAEGVGLRRRYSYESQGVRMENLIVV